MRACSLWLTPVLAAIVMAGCSSSPVNGARTYPYKGPLIGNGVVQLSPTVGLPLEKMVYWGLYAGAAYLILDPLAPNWEIEEARMPEGHVHFVMTMKRYYAGGAGEARALFLRRARDLAREGGHPGFEVVAYEEGLQSSVLGSRRTTTVVIRLEKSMASELAAPVSL